MGKMIRLTNENEKNLLKIDADLNKAISSLLTTGPGLSDKQEKHVRLIIQEELWKAKSY
jgi:hypothetical protein